jgi:2-polyprenyl-3-methyl-5-hydroxy-6-metoxy-1,4-benzoquinol methylase
MQNSKIIHQLIQNIQSNLETLKDIIGNCQYNIAMDGSESSVLNVIETESSIEAAESSPTSATGQHSKIGRMAIATSVKADQLGEFPDITDNSWPEALSPFLIIKEEEHAKKLHRAIQIERILGVNPVGLDILDYGCGDGSVASHLAKTANVCVGYDINPPSLQDSPSNLHLTSDTSEITKFCHTFDLIILFDVIDHVVGGSAIELLKKVTTYLKPDGKIFIRCHPWTSRTGGHLYESRNKAFLHLALTPGELLKLNLECPPNIRTNRPLATYEDILQRATLNVLNKKIHTHPVEKYFDGDLLDRIININWAGNVDRSKAIKIMSTTYIDYLCNIQP